MGPIALPDGVLLLPHHYGAEDRERLLTLLRAVVSGCAQMVVEGAALEGLIARRVEWAGGLVLVHGLPAETEVDGIRALVAPLGAKHALVQLPSAQVAGTSWMERALKVPVLRALERAWKNPEHPLRAIGIHECPLREAAQYTDEPVELLAIVTAMVEHRMAHASVGVGKGDWGRSLDQALAERLRGRLPEDLKRDGFLYLIGDAGVRRPGAGVPEQLAARGLGIETGDAFRATPLVNASKRPMVRAYIAFGQSSDIVENTLERSRAEELFHMADELLVATVVVPYERSMMDGIDASDECPFPFLWAVSSGRIDEHPQPYSYLELPDEDNDAFASKITLWQARGKDSLGTSRTTALAHIALLRGLANSNTRSAERLDAHIADLLKNRLRTRWWKEAVNVLLIEAIVIAWLTRRTKEDVEAAHARVEQLRELDSKQQRRWWATVKYVRWLSARLAAAGSSLHRLEEIPVQWSHDLRSSRSGTPAGVWRNLGRGRLQIAIGQATKLGTSAGRPLTVLQLHGDLVVGVAALAIGDLDAASSRGHLVLDLATRYEIPVLRAFARELLAAVHELRGEYDVAAKLLFQSRSRYIALEDTSRILGVEQRLSRMGITF
ncbi:MAG: hypothetical protein IPN17_38545, partial [Deltaproteobacteria bacterium]|nr:hypothetical protein [Deltaproteobacteria bacterium]